MKYENRWRCTKVLLATVGIVILFPDLPAPVHPEALGAIATVLEAKVFRLKTDLHVPDLAGESMLVPTLEGRGWNHHNPNGAVALRTATRVEVTGIFNYSERGFILELAQEDTGVPRQPITARPRARIRIMVETPGTDPRAQRAEAFTLIAKVLDFTEPI